MHVSYSRFSCYLKCPYSHYLRYVEGLVSNKPARPLHFGKDFHKLLEVRADKAQIKAEWRRMRDEFYEMPGSWQSELGENYPQDIKDIFLDYQRMWKGTPLPDETEHPFELEVGYKGNEPIIFVGVIDELYKADKGLIVGEHKTFNRAPNANTLVMNTQKSLYCKACELIWGELPVEVQWDYIKSSPAKYPIWLEKSGRFSASKSNDITPASWKRACKEKGITDEAVLQQGDMYKGNEANYFFRVQQDVYPEMVEETFKGFIYTAKDIVRRGEHNKVKNMTRDCEYCEYRNICLAELSGGDRKYVVEKEFTTREDRESEESNGLSTKGS